MERLKWNSIGDRRFETGVDRGVLYVDGRAAVPWNGLISIDRKSTGGDATPVYMDGVKVSNEHTPEDFFATIQAYTYPEEFEECDGMVFTQDGLGFGEQPRKPFGLTYRTLIGNDVDGVDYGYKIHILYNAMVTPSSAPMSTLSGDPDAAIFSWNVSSTPAVTENIRPTAHFVIDSTKVKSDTLSFIEDALYGSSTTIARLPSSTELVTLFELWSGFEIIPNETTGLALLAYRGVDDLKGNQDEGFFTATPTTRLKASTTDEGFYILE